MYKSCVSIHLYDRIIFPQKRNVLHKIFESEKKYIKTHYISPLQKPPTLHFQRLTIQPAHPVKSSKSVQSGEPRNHTLPIPSYKINTNKLLSLC